MASVKNKIRLGTLFLFALLLLAGGIGIYYLVQLKNDSKAILHNNYESLQYAHNMQRALDSIDLNFDISINHFEQNLQLQEANITEPGEKEITQSLRVAFSKLKQHDTSSALEKEINHYLQSVLYLNMHSIEIKNQKAEANAEKALTYISLIAALIFLVAITFSYNFPFIITNPIKELTKGIQEIAAKNYSQRIHLKNNDEFG